MADRFSPASTPSNPTIRNLSTALLGLALLSESSLPARGQDMPNDFVLPAQPAYNAPTSTSTPESDFRSLLKDDDIKVARRPDAAPSTNDATSATSPAASTSKEPPFPGLTHIKEVKLAVALNSQAKILSGLLDHDAEVAQGTAAADAPYGDPNIMIRRLNESRRDVAEVINGVSRDPVLKAKLGEWDEATAEVIKCLQRNTFESRTSDDPSAESLGKTYCREVWNTYKPLARQLSASLQKVATQAKAVYAQRAAKGLSGAALINIGGSFVSFSPQASLVSINIDGISAGPSISGASIEIGGEAAVDGAGVAIEAGGEGLEFLEGLLL